MKSTDRGTHSWSVYCLKTLAGHPPGPDDLPVLREANLLNTIDEVMLVLDSETSLLLSMWKTGAVLGSSCVKTLEKYLLSAYHLRYKVCH